MNAAPAGENTGVCNGLDMFSLVDGRSRIQKQCLGMIWYGLSGDIAAAEKRRMAKDQATALPWLFQDLHVWMRGEDCSGKQNGLGRYLRVNVENSTIQP